MPTRKITTAKTKCKMKYKELRNWTEELQNWFSWTEKLVNEALNYSPRNRENTWWVSEHNLSHPSSSLPSPKWGERTRSLLELFLQLQPTYPPRSARDQGCYTPAMAVAAATTTTTPDAGDLLSQRRRSAAANKPEDRPCTPKPLICNNKKNTRQEPTELCLKPRVSQDNVVDNSRANRITRKPTAPCLIGFDLRRKGDR